MTHELRIERLVDATPDVVFDAFVDPEAQKELYNNEDEPDWHVESEVDLRVGGAWSIVFGKPGEEPFRLASVFSEVDRPRRLVFTATLFQGKYGGSFETDVSVTFEDRDGKTLMTIVETGFPTKEQRDMIESGWPSILDALERVAAGGRS